MSRGQIRFLLAAAHRTDPDARLGGNINPTPDGKMPDFTRNVTLAS